MARKIFTISSSIVTQQEDEEIQVSSLIYSVGSDAERVFSQFNLSEEDSKNFDTMLEKFRAHFVPPVNVIHERATFHKRSQREGESVEEYFRSLFELSEHAQFAEKEETIRDRLDLGVQDQELSRKLQLESDLTLDKVVSVNNMNFLRLRLMSRDIVLLLLLHLAPFLADRTDSHVVVGLVVGLNPS